MPVFIRVLLGRALMNRSAMWCQVLSSIDRIIIGLLSPLPETYLHPAYVTECALIRLYAAFVTVAGCICYGFGGCPLYVKAY